MVGIGWWWRVDQRQKTRNTVRKYFLDGVIEFPPLFPYEWSPPCEKRVVEDEEVRRRLENLAVNVKTEFKGGYLYVSRMEILSYLGPKTFSRCRVRSRVPF